jgi:hypothetical protein
MNKHTVANICAKGMPGINNTSSVNLKFVLSFWVDFE